MQEIEQTIDSREVAGMVEKDHSKLLRDIRTYIGQLTESKIGFSDFFKESEYNDCTGRTLPCYRITLKGCEFIAHKMTGRKGTEFTARYINRFHEMESIIDGEKAKAAPAQRGQQVSEKNTITPVKTRVEKIPEGIETKSKTSLAYNMKQLDFEINVKADVFTKLVHLVEVLGGEVHFVTFKSKSEGMMVADKDLSNLIIGIRSEMDFDKYIYNIAYELAHYFLHFDKGNTITSGRHKEYEEQADRGAKMLLMALAETGI